MAEIKMLPVPERAAQSRPVMDTGVSMLGLEGDDWVCGHCGRTLASQINLRAMSPRPLFRCGGCGGLNDVP